MSLVGEILDQISFNTKGRLIYRGIRNNDYEPFLPSIFRENKKELFNNQEESQIIANFLKDNSRMRYLPIINTLSHMQHYEYPTRLIDLTTNPLVALFFACWDKEENYQNDGVLYSSIENEYELNDGTPSIYDSVTHLIDQDLRTSLWLNIALCSTISEVANLLIARFNEFKLRFSELMHSKPSRDFANFISSELYTLLSKHLIDKKTYSDFNSFFDFVYSATGSSCYIPSINERIFSQHGLHIVIAGKYINNIEVIKPQGLSYFHRIIIDVEKKQPILDELDRLYKVNYKELKQS